MKARKHPLMIGIVPLLFSLVLSAGAQTPMQYRGRFFGTEAQFKLKIDRFTTPDEVRNLYELLAAKDFKKFYEVLPTMDVGNIQFIGTSQTNIHFQLAVQHQTEKGIRLLLFADSKAVRNTSGPTEWGLRPFYVVELTLNSKFQGEGRIIGTGSFNFTEEGSLGLASFWGEPQMLSQVRAVK